MTLQHLLDLIDIETAALVLRSARLDKKERDQKCRRSDSDPARPNAAHDLTDKERQDHWRPKPCPGNTLSVNGRTILRHRRREKNNLSNA